MISLFTSDSIFAQFTLSGEIRPRTELSHGYGTLSGADQERSLFTSQRTRLNLDFKKDKLITKICLQDIRTWGNQAQLVQNELFSTSIHEAWAEAFFNENISLKVGRQELVYNDHRIFGNVGWAQQARSHDLALLKYESDFKVHFGIAYHENTNRQNNFYLGPDAYKAMQFLWVNKKTSELDISFLFLNNGTPFVELDNFGNVTKETINYSQTIGPIATYKMGDIVLNGNVYLQAGKTNTDQDLSAYEVAIGATYNLMSNVTLSGGFERLSGTDYDETVDNKSFNPFYGTNHKFNGFMDYFYVGNHANNVGLNDIHFKGTYKQENATISAKFHIFSSAAEVAADADKYLGTEIDIFGTYKLSEDVSIGAGYSQMLASSSMEIIKGGDKGEIHNWAWVMLTFKPVFFKQENRRDRVAD